MRYEPRAIAIDCYTSLITKFTAQSCEQAFADVQLTAHAYDDNIARRYNFCMRIMSRMGKCWTDNKDIGNGKRTMIIRDESGPWRDIHRDYSQSTYNKVVNLSRTALFPRIFLDYCFCRILSAGHDALRLRSYNMNETKWATMYS